jgi:hypothetical protein
MLCLYLYSILPKLEISYLYFPINFHILLTFTYFTATNDMKLDRSECTNLLITLIQFNIDQKQYFMNYFSHSIRDYKLY